MSSCTLRIGPTGIELFAGREHHISPACAVARGRKDIVTGTEATALARLNPRQTHSTFWSRLSLEPLTGNAFKLKHTADLAYLHLQQVWGRHGSFDQVILALAPSFSGEQLGIIAGITRELSIPVRGIVDAAVAAAAVTPMAPQSLLLELQQQGCSLTTLTTEQGHIKRTAVELLDVGGLQSLQNAWVNVIAHTFLAQTRFDPLHHADSEQSLYNQLDGWLTLIEAQGNAELSLGYRNQTHRIQLAWRALLDAAQTPIALLCKELAYRGVQFPLALWGRQAALPGLSEMLRQDGHSVSVLADEDIARGAGKYQDQICLPGEPFHYVTRLPHDAGSATGGGTATASEGTSESVAADAHSAPAPGDDGDPSPTHVLYGNTAWALSGHPLLVGSARGEDGRLILSGEDRGSQHCSLTLEQGRVVLRALDAGLIQVNGDPAGDSRPLVLGDEIVLGEHRQSMRLIRVE